MTLNDLIVEILTDPRVSRELKIFVMNPSHIAETDLANAMRDVIARPRVDTVQ